MSSRQSKIDLSGYLRLFSADVRTRYCNIIDAQVAVRKCRDTEMIGICTIGLSKLSLKICYFHLQIIAKNESSV